MTNKLPVNRLYLSPPHMSGQELDLVKEVFDSNWIAPLGPQVDAFEKELADRIGVKGAVALSAGTAAMHLALRLLGIGSGDSVVCSALTFAASVNPVLYQGAEPVFVDSEPESWTMSVDALERSLKEAAGIGRLPKGVIVVDLYGQSADFDPILKLCTSYEVPVIEDAAEALGATYREKPCGSYGKFAVLSFNGNKIVTTSGGGALLSDDLEALERGRYLACQARLPARHYEHSEVGYNYRLSNILAAVGRAQLAVLEERVRKKRAIFERYRKAFAGIDGIKFMPEAGYGRSSCWLTVMTVDQKRCGVTRNDLIERLEEENIESRPVWKPMQLQPLFAGSRYYEHEPGNSVSEILFENGLCLPSGTNMTAEEQDRVITIIKKLLK